MNTTTFPPAREAFRQMLATLATKTKTKLPALNGRVEKAVKLALAGDVALHDNGTATVYSSSDPTRRYEIIEGTCTCQDWDRAPEHLCQHRLSAGLVRRTYALLPVHAYPGNLDTLPCEPFPDNDPGPVEEPEPTPAPALPLPEAPCSVNCHVTISGRQVQVTLRGQDETEVLTRLEALLARYPVLQAPAPEKSAGTQLSPQQFNALAQHRPITGVCPIHQVAMQEQEKAGKRWFSHRTDEGWCKGR